MPVDDPLLVDVVDGAEELDDDGGGLRLAEVALLDEAVEHFAALGQLDHEADGVLMMMSNMLTLAVTDIYRKFVSTTVFVSSFQRRRRYRSINN